MAIANPIKLNAIGKTIAIFASSDAIAATINAVAANSAIVDFGILPPCIGLSVKEAEPDGDKWARFQSETRPMCALP